METKQLMQAKLWVIGVLTFAFVGMAFVAFHFGLNYYTLKYEKGDQRQMIDSVIGSDCKIDHVDVWMTKGE